MRINNLKADAQASVDMENGLEGVDGIFLDWDGCVAIGNYVLPAARALIERHADRVVILSNNSTHLPEDLSTVLARDGVRLSPERIVLAGVEAVRNACAANAERVLMFASPRMRAFARGQGLDLVREDPDLVVLMRDARFGYAKLERAANALQAGVPMIVANADRTHPGTSGRLVPETGALLAALLACVPNAKRTIVGKPGPILFRRACAILGIAPRQAVMIGDNPETDIKGAIDFGIRSILVGGRSTVALDDLIAPVAMPG
jgi:HAD superfamily hydrolase (TIGR01450 family)